jgi:hypothetical protein
MTDAQNTSEPINWPGLIARGAAMALEMRQKAVAEVDNYTKVEDILRRSVRRPGIEYRDGTQWSDTPFIVTIPPFLPNHFEYGAILAPFGETYWPTWDQAKGFYDSVLAGIRAGSYSEGWNG